eukprot:5851626-Alexandrium_andersonii.AAC.1
MPSLPSPPSALGVLALGVGHTTTQHNPNIAHHIIPQHTQHTPTYTAHHHTQHTATYTHPTTAHSSTPHTKHTHTSQHPTSTTRAQHSINRPARTPEAIYG